MNRKCFTITTNISKYRVVVDYRNGNPRIYIGGSKRYCMSIEGNILDVKKGDACFDLIQVKFTHKASDMLRALLYFVKTRAEIKQNSKILFTDTSENVPCGNLSSYYIAFCKKTWYEKDFGAYLINEQKLTPRGKYDLRIPDKYLVFDVFDVINMYKDHIETLDNPDYHNRDIKIALQTYLESNISSRAITEEVIQIYDQTKTIYEFFTKLKNVYGQDKCKKLNLPLWLDKFIKYTLNFKFINGQKWVIDCDLMNYDYDFDCEIIECDGNVPKKYLSVNQIGNGKKKRLTARERESYENPGWIGWDNIKVNEYVRKDKRYLSKLQKSF